MDTQILNGNCVRTDAAGGPHPVMGAGCPGSMGVQRGVTGTASSPSPAPSLRTRFQTPTHLPARTNDLLVSVRIRGLGRVGSPLTGGPGRIPTHASVRVEFESVRATAYRSDSQSSGKHRATRIHIPNGMMRPNWVLPLAGEVPLTKGRLAGFAPGRPRAPGPDHRPGTRGASTPRAPTRRSRRTSGP